ncbi:MAG: hypothetical protein AB7G11_08305 [Phycisphaerales bacterium]
MILKRTALALAAIVALAGGVGTYAPVFAGGGGGGGGGGNTEIRLVARMGSNDQFQAKGVYRERLRNAGLFQRFNVSIEDGVPGETYEISVNGLVFGTITANDLGVAELEFGTFTPDDNPGDEHPPVPEDFPQLRAGDTITVGNLSGVFVAR